MVAHYAVHAGLCQTCTTEKIATANNYTDLDAQLDQLFYFLSHAIQNASVDPKAFCTLQGFTTQFEQDTLINGFCIGCHGVLS
ncbi:hypothetical protein D3C79_876860 [compost metagenome]